MLNKIKLFAILATSIIVSASFAEDAKSAKEWIEIIEKQAIKEEKDFDEEFKTLRLGAAICLGHYNARTYVREPFAPKYKKAKKAFFDFMNGYGKELVNKWLKNEPFSVEDKKYQYIIQGVLVYCGALKDRDRKGRFYNPAFTKEEFSKFKKYAKKINDEGVLTIRKGYETGLLSKADIEKLRLYKIKQLAKGHDEFLPHDQGYHYLDGSGKKPHGNKKWILYGLQGKQAPNIKSPFLETILKEKNYSDLFDYDYSASWSYRADGVLEFLKPISGYVMDTDNGKKTAIRKAEYLEEHPNEKQGEYFELSALRGKKPIVLVINDPSDSAFSHWAYTEIIQQAYKEKFDFYAVSLSIWDQTMGNPNYFNPVEKGKRGLRNGHYFSMHDRARRTKNRYIESPSSTFPCILDDMVQTIREQYVSRGGQNHFVIIDIDGKVAARGQSNMKLPIQWINDLEESLNKVIDAEGKAIEQPIVKKDNYCSYTRYPLPERQYLLIDGEITSVNLEENKISVSAKVGKSKKEYTAKIDTGTRVTRNGESISLNKLKAGDSCNIYFKDEDYYKNSKIKVTKQGNRHAEKFEITGDNSKGKLAVRWPLNHFPYNRAVSKFVSDNGNGEISSSILIESNTNRASDNNIWFSGKVKTISNNGETIIVKQILADKKDMKGYSFAKAAGDKCKLTPEVKERMDVIDIWHNIQENERVYSFLIDDAVGVFLNGEYKNITAKNIKTGDFVNIELNTVQAKKKIILPNTIRISRKKAE